MKKKLKIFDLDYLQNSEFSEDDLFWLFDTNSFIISLIVGMFAKYETADLSSDKIIKIIKEDKNWMYKHFWTRTQLKEFRNILIRCYKNLYQYSDIVSSAYADMWLVMYGFTSASRKKKKMLLLSD